MGKISSSAEVAREAVSGLDKLEKPKIKKIELGGSNLKCMENALKLVEVMEQSLSGLVDTTKSQADRIVKLADKKEQDDKNDGLEFSTSLGGAWVTGNSAPISNTNKHPKSNKKTDWKKYGQEKLEDAGVYFNPDGSGYAVDSTKVIDNIVHGFADGAFTTYTELHDQAERRQAWEQKNSGSVDGSNPLMPNKPDFDPNP